VQEHLQNGDRKQKGPHADRASKAPSLLRGLLFSEQNRAFTPGYTQKGTKFYRYYINTDAIKLGKTGCEIQRLPAGEIETVVVEKLCHVLRAPEVLAHAVREVSDLRPKIKEAECIRALQSIDPVWDELFPSEQANIVRTLVERITVRREGISIQWRDQGMNNLLRETLFGVACVGHFGSGQTRLAVHACSNDLSPCQPVVGWHAHCWRAPTGPECALLPSSIPVHCVPLAPGLQAKLPAVPGGAGPS